MAQDRCHFFLFVLLFLSQFSLGKLESLCSRDPRPPPGGCCPKKYLKSCCPVAGDNERIVPCDKNISSAPTTQQPQAVQDSRILCVHQWNTQACAGGFYQDSTTKKVTTCPAGFFCPVDTLCIIPCPSGAYCVPKQKRKEKSRECRGFGVCCGKEPEPPLIQSDSRKCNGTNDSLCLCGGPEKPIPCPGGYYCPTTDTKIPCRKGHYCRPGSTEPDPCPFLTKCGKKVSAPIKNFTAPLLDFFVLLLFFLLLVIYNKWRVIKFYCNLHFARITGRERSPTQSFELKKGLTAIYKNGVFVDANPDIKPKSFTIDISFQNLGLTLNSGESKGKVVLQGVTGHVRSGEVTAVMGPSGAGKTTFLNTLSGKAYYGDTTGNILFNGQEVKGIKAFRSITGFVPQEDTMHRNLTVKEVLYYQAMLRLPSGTNKRDVNHKIHQVLNILEIGHVADSLIGDEETRGISGGQRKRVNIGMELVTDPTLLFLDEPTSGLDSTSSLSVLNSLRTVAEEGKLTVLCVIHQPRFEIFNMFHNVLLLGPGGKTVYQGSVSGAKDYFSMLGYETPANINPADHYMDVIGGSVDPKEGFEKKDLFKSWNEYYSENPTFNNANSDAECSNVVHRKMPNPLLQFLNFVQREFLLQIRSVKTLLIDIFLVFIAGGILGALYLEVKLEKFNALTRMSGMAIGLTAMLASLRCFGNYRTTFWRESAAGVNRVSYFLAVNFAQLPIIILMPLVYLSLLYTLTSPRSYFVSHYTAVLSVQICCTGMGYAISTIFNPKSSQMASVVIVLVMAMISGASPTLCTLDKLNFFGPVSYNLSYIRWFVEALFEKEGLRYPDVDRPLRDRFAFQDHYTLDGNYTFCVGIIVLMGIVYRVFALLFLLFTNRGKQK